ncbi:MAG: FtsX-like permease family protein, partial [Gemmatimonadetes bacterium]|nr:FtsX-like permease family protein [Gemmatimonadota bacterium]
ARAAAMRAAAKELDADLYVHGAMTAEASAGAALFLPRMGAGLLAGFGALALLMAAIGLYGVVSYTVAQRRKEVGIRLSLGATAEEVVRMLMSMGLAMVAVGILVGLAVAFAAGQALERFLFGVSGADPVTFLLVPVFLLSVAALAAWIPARRASGMEPSEALRSE